MLFCRGQYNHYFHYSKLGIIHTYPILRKLRPILRKAYLLNVSVQTMCYKFLWILKVLLHFFKIVYNIYLRLKRAFWIMAKWQMEGGGLICGW